MVDTEHDCFEHLHYHCDEAVETHGLDCGPHERRFEEWWECAVCKWMYTAKELEREAQA